ncbi:MAG: hypothetical protein ACHQF2_07310 [Flavobacteriales bacterium]
MSNVGSSLLQCEDLQAELDSKFLTCNHAMLHRESPFTQFIMSDQNRSGIQQTLVPSEGKFLNAVLRYDQKPLLSTISEVDDCNQVCSAGTPVGDLSATYQVDPCIKLRTTTESITAMALSRVCRDNMDYVINRINIMAAALEAKVAEKFAEDAVALIGNWASDVSPLTGGITLQVATRLTGGINLNSNFPSKINMAAKKTGYCGQIGIFGSSELYEAWDNLNVGCCADNGINLFEMMRRYNKAVMWDSYIVAALNEDDRNALMTQLGAMQPVFANMGSTPEFRNVSGPGSRDFEMFSMTTPRYGIPFDLTITNTCGNLSWTLETSPWLFAAPLDMFPVTDVYEGVNFVNQIQVTNP